MVVYILIRSIRYEGDDILGVYSTNKEASKHAEDLAASKHDPYHEAGFLVIPWKVDSTPGIEKRGTKREPKVYLPRYEEK